MNSNDELHPENHRAFYSNAEFVGEAESRLEKFRRWSHRKKRWVFALFLLVLVGGASQFYKKSSPRSPEDLVRGYFNRFLHETDRWVYRVDRYYIDEQHLHRQYPILARYTWGEQGARELIENGDLYRDYLREQLNTDLLVYGALKEGVLNSEEGRLILENGLRRLIAEYYLYTKIKSKTTDYRTGTSPAEAERFYKKNKKFYERRNLNKTQALAAIGRTLTDLKQQKLREDLEVRRKKLLDSLRDGAGYQVRQPDMFR